MTISAYQVDGVIKAYAKQSRMRGREPSTAERCSEEKYDDVVTLSVGKDQQAYQAISYNILDVILKAKER